MFHNREFTLVQIKHVLSVSGGKSSIVLRMLHHVRKICSIMCGNVLHCIAVDDDNLIILNPIEDCSAVPREYINASVIDVSFSLALMLQIPSLIIISPIFRDIFTRKNTLLLKV